MRFTCIALAAVALALATQQHRAPGLASDTTPHRYAVAAPAGAAWGSTAALAPAPGGEIDFTPLPAAHGDDARAGDAAPLGTALVLRSDTTRCVTVRQGARAAAPVVASCGGAVGAQAFAYPGGEIRTAADLCVTAPEQPDNAVRPVALVPCNGSAAQRWAATAAGEFRGYRGTCLTAAAGLRRREGTPLAVRGCMGRVDQRWTRRARRARTRSA
jgi:hypothetical protein